MRSCVGEFWTVEKEMCGILGVISTLAVWLVDNFKFVQVRGKFAVVRKYLCCVIICGERGGWECRKKCFESNIAVLIILILEKDMNGLSKKFWCVEICDIIFYGEGVC